MAEQRVEHVPSRKKNFYVTRRVFTDRIPGVNSRPLSPLDPEDLNLGNLQDNQSSQGKAPEEVGLIQGIANLDSRASLPIKNTESLTGKNEDENIIMRNQLKKEVSEKQSTSNIQNKNVISPELIKQKRLQYSLIFILSILICSLTNTGLSITFFVQIANDTYYKFDSMIETVKTGAYCNIEKMLVTELIDCSTPGATMLDLGQFSGTVVGCYCSGSSVVTVGECKSSSGCTTIKAVPSKSFTDFGGVQICGTKKPFIFNQTCSAGYKSCAGYICVEGNSCPINDILSYVSPGPTPSGSYAYVSAGTHDLHYISDDSFSNNMLLGFYYAHGQLCLAYDKNPKRNDYDEQYPLERVERIGCGKYGLDFQLSKIIESDEKTVLDANSVDYTNLTLFSNYITSQPVFLYARFAPKFNRGLEYDKCIANLNDICSSVNKVENYRDPSKYGGYGCLIVFGLLFVLIVIQFIVFMMRRKAFRKEIILRKVFVYYSYLVNVGCAIFLVVLIVNTPKSAYRDSVKIMANENCFISELMNIAFQDFNEYMDNITFRNILAIIIFSFTSIQTILATILSLLIVNLDKKVMNLDLKSL